MKADVTSVSGILLFVFQFLLVLFITSFPRYQELRFTLIKLTVTQIIAELALHWVIDSLIGIRAFRLMCMFILSMLALFHAEPEPER